MIMSGRNVKFVMRGVAGAAVLAAAPFASPIASAQEAILLETIGPVRMAQPAEVRRMSAERENFNARPRLPLRNEEQEASTR